MHLIYSLVEKQIPAEILEHFPLSYSLDKQIVFLFALSNDRHAQKGNIYGEESWRDKIFSYYPLEVFTPRESSRSWKKILSVIREKATATTLGLNCSLFLLIVQNSDQIPRSNLPSHPLLPFTEVTSALFCTNCVQQQLSRTSFR